MTARMMGLGGELAIGRMRGLDGGLAGGCELSGVPLERLVLFSCDMK